MSRLLCSACAAALVCTVVVVTAAPPARACGGLFCDALSPTPVDQNAERILFEVEDDGSVTATVEIKYRGDPSAFSWIVPVPGTPDSVDVATSSELALLDSLTRPSFTPPTGDFGNCSNGFGCALDAFAPTSEGEGEGNGVNVTAFENVGPFTDIIVVDSPDPAALVSFLNDNGYLITEAMQPFIAEYTLERQKFLAVQLAPDASVDDIVPIRFHCPAPNPVIPLRLTAVASEPDMSIITFVLADRRYTPANYGELVLGTDDVHMDDGGTTNYFALVSKRIDDIGGLGFVVERAGATSNIAANIDNTFLGVDDEDAAKEAVRASLQRRSYLTRFYTRMSAEEMFSDPFFVASDLPPERADVSGTIDFSSRVVDVCGGDQLLAPPCGTLYCGETDRCATTDSGEGCACGGQRVARAITSPTGALQPVCTGVDLDVLGGAVAACAGFDCGAGFCVPLNGSPTCNCDDGAAAVIDLGSGRLRCVAALETFAPDQIEWPTPTIVPAASGCAQTHKAFFGTFALLVGSMAALRGALRGRVTSWRRAR